MAKTATKIDVQDRITAAIIEGLEAAKSPTEWPWIKAATAGIPVNVSSGNAYNGVNRIVLGMAQFEGASRYWGTFKQWQDKGAQIIKGSKSTPVVYYGDLWVDENDRRVEPHTPGARKIVYPKGAAVFHGGQVEGWTAPADAFLATVDRTAQLDEIEAFISNTGAIVHEGGAEAFYRPGIDQIQMPARVRFKDTATATATEHFYGVLLHELIHWTGNSKRCNRDFSGRFGSTAYAFEELVAEIGSAFLNADLGLSPMPRADNINYVAGWLKVLKNDKKAVFNAASLSRKATEYLQASQPGDIVAVEAEEAKPEHMAA